MKASVCIRDVDAFIDAQNWQELEAFILDNHYSLFSQGLHQKVVYWISLLSVSSQNSTPIKLQLAYALIPDQETKAFGILYIWFGKVNQLLHDILL